MPAPSRNNQKRLTHVNLGFLVLQGAIGGYLVAVPDRTSFVLTQSLVLLHVVTCVVWFPVFAWWFVRHSIQKLSILLPKGNLWSVGGTIGLLLLSVVLLGFGSGYLLLGKGAATPLATLHAITGMAVLVPLGLHLWFERRRLLVGAVLAGAVASAAGITTVKDTVAGEALHPSNPKFSYADQDLARYDTAEWCGSCHEAVYGEWQASTHHRTMETDKVRHGFEKEQGKHPLAMEVDLTDWGKLVKGDPDLLKKLPKDDVFLACPACHAPAGFYAGLKHSPIGAPAPVGDGVTCAFCHTLRGFGGGGMDLNGAFEHLRQHKSWDNRLVVDELPFYVSGPGTVRRYLWQNDPRPTLRWIGDLLIRWRPSMHSHDYHPEFLNTSLACHGCHGIQGSTMDAPGRAYDAWAKSDYNKPDASKRTECQDCHMAHEPDGGPVKEPGRLVAWAPDRPQRRLHYFLGGNVNGARPHDTDYIEKERALRAKAVEFAIGHARVEGDKLSVDVSLHNKMNAHFFPAFETAMRYAWVDVAVYDAKGAQIAHSRALDGTPTDGCKPGMDPIVYYRIVTPEYRVTADSLVRPDQTRVDTASYALPTGATGPFRVEAILHHNCDSEPVARAEATVSR